MGEEGAKAGMAIHGNEYHDPDFLPLLGGTMAGNIDMATKRILHLPAPVADEEPLRKIDGGGGGGGFDPFTQWLDLLNWGILDWWQATGIGDFSISQVYPIIDMACNSGAGTEAWASSTINWWWLYEIAKALTIEIPIFYLDSVNPQTLWLPFLQNPLSINIPAEEHFGFMLDGSTLWASTRGPTGLLQTDTGYTMASGQQNTRLKVIFTPTSDCKFYVNGVLKVTHTTHLPTFTEFGFSFRLICPVDDYREVQIARLIVAKAY
jgi:hypothetical protein